MSLQRGQTLCERNPVFAMATRISLMENKIVKYAHQAVVKDKLFTSCMPKGICMDCLPCRFESYFLGNRIQKQLPN